MKSLPVATKSPLPVFLLFILQISVPASADDEPPTNGIVPNSGYEWVRATRTYWPTDGWKTAPADEHGIDPDKMAAASQLARNDEYFRALLVVKDGLLVFEEYFNGGTRDQSTEVWSVTKSVISALVGIAIDEGHIDTIDDLMTRYLPEYPEFGDLSIRHVLTHTTGLEWTEEGGDFVAWIESEDWVGNAVRRERLHPAGQVLLYSSGNSHFLSALILATTGMSPGEYAREQLFEPLGIDFQRQPRTRKHVTWNDFLVRTPGTWKRDITGLEVGAFGLSLTAREMAKFGYLYLNKGRWDDDTLISGAWVEESTQDHVRRTDNFRFGYHWVVSRRAGRLAFNADGWGGQIICVIPSLDMIVVVKSDAESPGSHAYYDTLAKVIDAASPPEAVPRSSQ